MFRTAAVWLVCLAALAGCAQMVETKGSRAVGVETVRSSDTGTQKILTQSELQAELMNFADRYSQMLGVACKQVEHAYSDSDLRLLCKQAKVFSISSVIGIAAGPSPEASLLDMLVVVTLNRMVWDDYGNAQYFGERVSEIRRTLSNLEGEIWQISARVLSLQAQEETRNLIDAWRKKNPNVKGVNFIRFSEFSSLHGRDVSGTTSGGGILSQVTKVTQQVDASLLLAERGMYLLSRLQLLAGLQVDLAFMQIMTEPEVEQVREDINRLTDFTQTLPAAVSKERAEAIEQLALSISREREMAINQAMEKVAFERNASISQFMDSFAKERGKTIEQAAMALRTERFDLTRQLIEAQNHGFLLGMIFLFCVLVGSVFSALCYRYLRYRLIDSK